MSSSLLVCEYVSGGGLADAPDLLAQGLAMRDALLADLAVLPGTRLACVQGPGVPRVEAARAVLAQPGEPLLELVRREARRHDRVWVVAPESEGCLAALAEAVEPRRWIGCTPPAIRLCASKRATLALLAAQGIATPLQLSGAASRWLVKPDDGAGAVATRVHATRAAAEADLAERAARGAPATLEPWVDGPALSFSLLVPGGSDQPAELLSVNRQRIAVAADGALAFEGVDILALGPADARHAALRATAAAVARAVPGLHGFVGVDLVWHASRGPVVIEINPRLTSAYPGLSAALGRNLAGEVLALHGGGP